MIYSLLVNIAAAAAEDVSASRLTYNRKDSPWTELTHAHRPEHQRCLYITDSGARGEEEKMESMYSLSTPSGDEVMEIVYRLSTLNLKRTPVPWFDLRAFSQVNSVKHRSMCTALRSTIHCTECTAP